MKVGLVNYDAGNLHSVYNALQHLNQKTVPLNNYQDFKNIDLLVLPGVGHFGSAVISLKNKGLFQPIMEWLQLNKPFLGICLGLQLLFSGSEESDSTPGFGFFKANIKKFTGRIVPQIGWNKVNFKQQSLLQQSLEADPFCYFLHSYYIDQQQLQQNWVIATTVYQKIEYPSLIQKGSVVGMQFHPEKSGVIGLKLLENFLMNQNEVI